MPISARAFLDSIRGVEVTIKVDCREEAMAAAGPKAGFLSFGRRDLTGKIDHRGLKKWTRHVGLGRRQKDAHGLVNGINFRV